MRSHEHTPGGGFGKAPSKGGGEWLSRNVGIGKDFEDGKLTLEQAYEYGKKVEEPKQTSGKQEKYETIVALYAK